MNRCAGILLCSERTARCLTLLRTDGFWDLPGGHAENYDVSELETALRELSEETGYGSRLSLARPRLRVSWCPELVIGHVRNCRTQYTGFVGYVPHEFAVILDQEHVDWAWAPPHCLPDPTLPGVEFMVRWAQEQALV